MGRQQRTQIDQPPFTTRREMSSQIGRRFSKSMFAIAIACGVAGFLIGKNFSTNTAVVLCSERTAMSLVQAKVDGDSQRGNMPRKLDGDSQMRLENGARCEKELTACVNAARTDSRTGQVVTHRGVGDGSWGPDPFGWNKPPNYQWKNRKHMKQFKDNPWGKAEPGEKQLAFDAHRERRHAAIGPTIKKMAAANKNTILLLIVNSGQMSLFLNFICSCEKRNLAWKEFTFVFALDAKAKELLDRLGVASYHLDDTDIASAAKQFSDAQFSKVIFYKSAVTYDVLLLGVHVLFQDVDIVWQTSPIDYFHDPSRAEVDIFFMKDGNSKFQQPLYANSGFHFNRNNERTLQLWEETYLHAHTARVQQMVIQPLLMHHYFVNSLRLYILPVEFANGNLWGTNPKQVGKIPKNWIVLHASWTSNATHKIKKFEAMQEWYSACIDAKSDK